MKAYKYKVNTNIFCFKSKVFSAALEMEYKLMIIYAHRIIPIAFLKNRN